jgi:hypothetical protein
MMRDLYHNLGVKQILPIADLAHTDTVTDWVDLQGFAAAGIQVNIGDLTGVDGSNYLTPVLQESDTIVGTAFTDVAAADIMGGFTKVDATGEDSTVQTAFYMGLKRYIRVKLDYTGTGISAGFVGAVALVGHPESAPVVAPTTGAAT